MPLVSIIIPVYNSELYLRKCLDCICSQTLSDIEIICINDCSTDNSLEILKEYSSSDSRIKIINQETNKGVSFARNTGINTAKSPYIGFVDADDYVDLDFFGKLYYKALQTNADAVKGNLKYVSKNKNIILETMYDNNKLICKNFAYFYCAFSSAIYNTNFIKTNKIYFPEKVNNFEDPYFSILASLYYTNVQVVNDANYYYIDNSASATKNLSQKNLLSSLESISGIADILNSSSILLEHYLISYVFLINYLKEYCWNINISEEVNKTALDLMTKMYTQCKNKDKLIQEYFKYEKLMRNLLILKHSKEKIRKTQDVLN